jgi:ribosomal protein L3
VLLTLRLLVIVAVAAAVPVSLSVPCVLLLQLKDAAKVAEYQPGQQLDIAAMFKEGDSIDIAGTTVGKGFQGEQRCWNMFCWY